MKYITLLILNISILGSNAQYTYFNTTYGDFGDQETELITNIEIIGDSIYLFGGVDNNKNPFSFLLRIISVTGELIDEQAITPNFNTTYLGQNTALATIEGNKFSYSTIAETNSGTIGLIYMHDLNLDTIWTEIYNQYSPYIELRANFDIGDGIIVLGGQIDDEVNNVGTFIMKIDYNGVVLWSKILRVGEENIYYNFHLVELINGFLIGGFKRGGDDMAMLTKTDQEGNIEWEYYADNFEDTDDDQAETKTFQLAQLPNGDIVGAHMVWYEYYGNQPWSNQDPSWYRSLHLSKINVEDTSFYWEHDFFTDQEFDSEMLWKILPTDDNGVLAMGMNENSKYLWLLKVDEYGNEEWFKTYESENYLTDRYEPFDIEQTSDGGFVIVGQHRNFLIESYSQSWVMKIDACGDTQWQGCDYVGIQESIQSKQFKIYPNPASQEIQLEGELLTPGDKVQIFDLSGRLILQETWSQNAVINISNLATGMYQLTVTNDKGTVVGQKLMVE